MKVHRSSPSIGSTELDQEHERTLYRPTNIPDSDARSAEHARPQQACAHPTAVGPRRPRADQLLSGALRHATRCTPRMTGPQTGWTGCANSSQVPFFLLGARCSLSASEARFWRARSVGADTGDALVRQPQARLAFKGRPPSTPGRARGQRRDSPSAKPSWTPHAPKFGYRTARRPSTRRRQRCLRLAR